MVQEAFVGKLSVEERTKIGLTNDMVRVSVGWEHTDDRIGDVCQALN